MPATEATERFLIGSDRHCWIRPDGAGTLHGDGEEWSFFLEYERGTLSPRELRSKLVGYDHYFAARGSRADSVVLFVCHDDRAVKRIEAALGEFPRVPALMTSEWRFRRNPANRDGLLGVIWRDRWRAGGLRLRPANLASNGLDRTEDNP